MPVGTVRGLANRCDKLNWFLSDVLGLRLNKYSWIVAHLYWGSSVILYTFRA